MAHRQPGRQGYIVARHLAAADAAGACGLVRDDQTVSASRQSASASLAAPGAVVADEEAAGSSPATPTVSSQFTVYRPSSPRASRLAGVRFWERNGSRSWSSVPC